MSLSLELAQEAAALGFADLPEEAVHAARVSLADGLAVMLAAVRREPAVAAFAEHALAFGGTPEALLLGRRKRAPAALAALANGALSHALDFEDTFDATGVHPNGVVIPAVLALAERDGAAGEELVVALALGCDAVCRLSLAMRSDPAARGWYFPPMLGALGAALACARLLRLTPQQGVDALALTACQFALTGELKRAPDSHLRAVRDGLAARAAVEGALLAARGVRGVDLPLEGEEGVFSILTGQPPDEAALLDGLGRRFHGPDVSLKLWPSCRGTHAAIVAGLDLRREGIVPEQIAAAVFDVAPPDDMLLQPAGQRQRPRTAIDAKFSIPFTFATALAEGNVGLGDFEAGALRDRVRLAVAGRVRLGRVVGENPRLLLELTDGTRREVALGLPPSLRAGAASAGDLLPKLQACLAEQEGTDAEALLAACMTLGAVPSRGLFDLLDS